MRRMSKLRTFLASFPDLGARPQGHMRSADFTLDRMQFLVQALGHPERQYPGLHIAGTNGKGSVSAFCAAALQAQGYRLGRFTSPHLAGALAGITVNASSIPEADLEATFNEMLPHLEQRQDWTQFEIVTALAFAHFARVRVDAAVIEVGLGGRLDATNVLTPLVSVITPIDYDHTCILGTKLAEIAAEKAGIIKEGVPVVLSPQPDEALASILHIAKEKRAQVIEVGKGLRFRRISSGLDGQVCVFSNHNQKVTRLKIGMLGLHQVENAATAFAALQAANQRGLEVSTAAIERGFAAVRWPGRFELVCDDPPVVLDAAHTPAAAQALRAGLDEYFPERPVILVLGVSADKDLAGIIEPLRARIASAIATQAAHPRAIQAGELQGRLGRFGVQATSEPDPSQALRKAIDLSRENHVVLVCGSVFLVEAIEQTIEKSPR